MQRGDTVLMPAGPRRSLHLWIIATDPDPQSNLAVIVSVTTLRHAADQTVVLRKGDHQFIQHDSAVYFGDSRIIDVSRLKEYPNHKPCSAALADEILSGLRASPFTPKKILNFLDGMRPLNAKGASAV